MKAFRFIPPLLFSGLAILSFILDFNGLYGRDTHEYLRRSGALFDYLNQGAVIPATPGDGEFAGGYSFAGALLRFISGSPVLSLQIISWLAFALSAWLMERILVMLAHGSRADSRWMFVLLGLVMAPVFIRSGLTAASDASGLALALATLLFALRWIEHERGSDLFGTIFFAALTLWVRIELAGMMLPLALMIVRLPVQRKQWRLLTAVALAGVIWIFYALRTDTGLLLHFPMLQRWSFAHFFSRSFTNGYGVSGYLLPNIVYLAFPLMHAGFCLLLPGLLLLAKKTDLALRSKKAVLISMAGYLFLLGGFPHQDLRLLLPAYALLLLLLFPAWDRMYCYGFYFFRRLTSSILGLTVLVQSIAIVWMLYPVVAGNRFEQAFAAELTSTLPAGSTLYVAGRDIAGGAYLPDIQWIYLEDRLEANIQAGAFVLFRASDLPASGPDYKPDFLPENYRFEMLKGLPQGWLLGMVTAVK